ncbi:hypothetical protein ALC56_00330 [Trachymyrmex septentrionalis]|uniref:Uncharacterized protein n=1 Tax=Trachymyrmex septentrionalis TaxID=34720 RepID=A0A151K156_9HYME|nr:hypothetical protein ALC56_00330 [Trachymyrmex septentrionalis]
MGIQLCLLQIFNHLIIALFRNISNIIRNSIYIYYNFYECVFNTLKGNVSLKRCEKTAVPDELLKTIWLGRIPTSMRVILVTQTEAGLDKMAELADAVSDALPERHQVAAVSTDSFEMMLERLTIHITAKMGELANGLRQEIAAVEDRVSARGSRSRERRSPSRQRARSRGRGKDGVCWYHWRFGADATRCEPPCNFRSGNDQGGR